VNGEVSLNKEIFMKDKNLVSFFGDPTYNGTTVIVLEASNDIA
jgi:hypothetical protein